MPAGSVRDPGHPLLRPERELAVIDADRSDTDLTGYLGLLVYELLDAHVDTIKLAYRGAGGPRHADAQRPAVDLDPSWEAHLDYLRDLQRVGREALARLERVPL